MVLHPKVANSTIVGALSAIVLGEISRHGIPVSAAEASGITVLLGLGVGYLTGNGGDDSTPPAALPPAPPVAG